LRHASHAFQQCSAQFVYYVYVPLSSCSVWSSPPPVPIIKRVPLQLLVWRCIETLDIRELLPTWTIKGIGSGTSNSIRLLALIMSRDKRLVLFAVVIISLASCLKHLITAVALQLIKIDDIRHLVLMDSNELEWTDRYSFQELAQISEVKGGTWLQ